MAFALVDMGGNGSWWTISILCVLRVRFRRGWRVRGGAVEAHRDFAADVLSVGDADSFEGKPQKPGLAADGKDPDFVRWNEGRGDFAGLKSVPPFRKKPVVERGGGLVNADAPLGNAVERGFIGTVGNPPAGCDFRGTEAVERHTTRKGRRRVRAGVLSPRGRGGEGEEGEEESEAFHGEEVVVRRGILAENDFRIVTEL